MIAVFIREKRLTLRSSCEFFDKQYEIKTWFDIFCALLFLFTVFNYLKL